MGPGCPFPLLWERRRRREAGPEHPFPKLPGPVPALPALRTAEARVAILLLESPNSNKVHPKESYLTSFITEGQLNLLHILAGP